MTIRNIQGLRALAALLVVCVHFGNANGFEHRYLHNPHPYTEMISRFGYFGVDLFFVISGFIMVMTTFRDGRAALRPLEFLKRRVIRIYPPLWIINCLILVLFVVKPSLVNSHGGAPTDVVASFLLLPQAGNALVLVSWTLVYEMLFYLVFAFGLIGGARGVAMTLSAWAIGIVALHYVTPHPTNVYSALVQNPIVYEFLLGTLVAVLVKRPLPAWLPLAVGGVGCLVTAAIVVPIALSQAAFPADWWRVACAVPIAAIVYGAVGLERAVGSVTPKPIEAIGDASYALYLWHVPALTAFGIVMLSFDIHGAFAQFFALIVGLSMVVAVGLLVYQNLELPLTALVRKWSAGGKSVPQPVAPQ